MMNWPWKQNQEVPSPITTILIDKARTARERAQQEIDRYLPEIDPNDTFLPDAIPKISREESPWTQ